MVKNIKVNDGSTVKNVERLFVVENQGTIFEVNYAFINNGGTVNTVFEAIYTTTRDTATTFTTAF